MMCVRWNFRSRLARSRRKKSGLFVAGRGYGRDGKQEERGDVNRWQQKKICGRAILQP